MFPKIVGFPPKSSIFFKGFSTIFTIHFGVFPYFWKILIHGNSEDISIFCCAIFLAEMLV